MLPANPYGGGTPLLSRGTPVAPVAPPGSFGVPMNDKGAPMPMYSMAPKVVPNIPQINPGPTGNLPATNPKLVTDVPQINPGPTGNLPSGRSALIRSVLGRAGGMGKAYAPPAMAPKPPMRRPFPRPPGG